MTAGTFDKGYRVRFAGIGDLDRDTIASWEELEENALEKNAYLSPDFVLPAVRRLGSPRRNGDTVFVFVERLAVSGNRLAAAGVFSRSRGTRRFPLPHLRSFLSPHSYRSGLLVDRENAEGAIRAFFEHFRGRSAPWHGIEFACRVSEGPQAERIAAVAEETGTAWHEIERSRRAVFLPSEGGERYLRENLPLKLRKELGRQRRRLDEMGHVDWRALFGDEVDDRCVERFLEIEHAGWKSSRGTSLRSHPSHEAFFREAVGAFRREGRVFFTELTLDGVVVASTSNFISGGNGFAFKVGYDPEYSRVSPGMLNEAECIRSCPGSLRGLPWIDSGAEEGSFIEQLWIRRESMTTGIFGTTPLGRKALSVVGRMRTMKRRLAGGAPS